MANIRTVDMIFIDDIFEMGSGYVLNFSNSTFYSFFASELNVNIDDPNYARNGSSKAKRLRCFLQDAEKKTAIRALKALWEYREALRRRSGQEEKIKNAQSEFEALINRLESKSESASPSKQNFKPAVDGVKIAQLKSELISLASLDVQKRGYEFEKFLKRLFDLYGLAAKEPFRLRGEQIDGSFQFANETYLVEAKWQGQPTGVADLHTFHGKIEQKAAWTRGLFISNSGFSEEGLAAFGRGKRVICMDGFDLYETLDRAIPFDQVLDRKIRRAAETGSPFVRVRDIFL